MSAEMQHNATAPPDLTSPVDSHTPIEVLRLTETTALAKAHLSWTDLALKSFVAGIFISLGAGFDLLIAGGSPGLRASNPAMATLIAALTFPTGFVLIMLTNMELCTSNMFVMAYAAMQRRITLSQLARNWVVSYVCNVAGCLFFAGILYYWADVLQTEAEISYAVAQATGRVEVNWGYNVTRGIMCNWLVGLAFFFATQGRDNTAKICGIWIAVATFVAMGYQHSIANFFLVPVGMFYGVEFGVGRFVWKSAVPITIGNIVGGAVFGAFFMWVVYGRHEARMRDGGDQRADSKV